MIGQKWLFLQGGNGLPTGLGIPAIIHWPSVQLQAKAEGREETVWQVKSPHYGLFSPFALKVEQSRKPENTCLAGNLHKMYPGARNDIVTEKISPNSLLLSFLNAEEIWTIIRFLDTLPILLILCLTSPMEKAEICRQTLERMPLSKEKP